MEECRALFTRTSNFLEGFYLINDIMMEARLTEVELMLTVTHPKLLVFPLHLHVTYFAGHQVPHFLKFTPKKTPQL
jgi:hypothetical protein